MVDRATALFGTDEGIPEARQLRAGPVTATLENGQLRWVKVNGVEALRAVSFLIRDSTWLTAAPEILDLRVDQGEASFSVEFGARCVTKDGNITWLGKIEGRPDGSIAFEGTARPDRDFTTCRTGFVVLHPLEGVAGQPVRVGFTDGRFEASRFPDLIDPYQTFKSIRSLSHEVIPGVTATCTMEGDAWEIEDHRNWTDASFKTYVRLLEWGFPYVIRAGEEIRQRVTLDLSGPGVAELAPAADENPVVGIDLGAPAGRFPELGLSLPQRRLDEAAEVAEAIRDVGPRFLHCRIDTAAGDASPVLKRFRELAKSLDSPVALEIAVSDPGDVEGQLRAANRLIGDAGLEPSAIIALPATSMLELSPGVKADKGSIAEVPRAARMVFPKALVGGGVFGFFAEFNRNPPPVEHLDFVTHITTALVHHNDDASVMETNTSIASVVRSARTLSKGKPHWLGPANIGLDDSPYGACTANPHNERLTMARMDPRHRGLFGAAWLVGYVAAAAGEGVARIVTGAPAGELGLAYARTDYRQPYFDEAGPGSVYPIYHVVRAFCRSAGAGILAVRSSEPQRVAAVGCQNEDETVLWLANLTSRPQSVRLSAATWRAVVLDCDSFANATRNRRFFDGEGRAIEDGTIALDAYAVARLQRRLG